MKTPVKNASASFKEKRSEFIGLIFSKDDLSSVQEELRSLRKTHHSSRHIAWAYRILNNDQLMENSSDDGEPSGSAGNPILGVLRKNEIVNGACYVIRYYGGIKLGKRGLIDAYRTGAESAVEEGSYKPWIQRSTLVIESVYEYAGRISAILEKFGLSVTHDSSTDRLHWETNVNDEKVEIVMEEMIRAGDGKIQCKKSGSEQGQPRRYR